MIKIAIIIPYTDTRSQIEAYVAEHIEKDLDIQIVDIVGTDERVIRAIDADIVVARGLTGHAVMRLRSDVHFVEIAVNGYDVIDALQECREKYGAKRVAVVMDGDLQLEKLESLCGMELLQYKARTTEEIPQALQQAVQARADVVIGGVTATTQCQKLGIHAVHFKTSAVAIEAAIKEALNAVHTLNVERTKAKLMRTVLDNSKEAIVAVDRRGRMLEINRKARHMFFLPVRREGAAVNIRMLAGEDKWDQELPGMDESCEKLVTVRGRLMLMTYTPITVQDIKMAGLISFQAADEVREMEASIRKRLRTQGFTPKYYFENILGNSTQMRSAIEMARRYSAAGANVLIQGESGTGKELFAQSIHNASPRALKPFVAINCATLPQQLLESELFGYAEGAFSGASKGGKVGLFEQAHKGTVFLDEIGEMPLELQSKLLRVLQEKEVRRIGDNRVIPVDVRVICATNVNINEAVRNGTFRLDLFYRINILTLYIPSLHERQADIPLLLDAFLQMYADRAGVDHPKVTQEAMRLLCRHSWPGNVRELENFCERAIILGRGAPLDEEMVLSARLFEHVFPEKRSVAVPADVAEKQVQPNPFEEQLKKKETKEEMARRLGISRSTLWRRSKQLNIQNKNEN